MQVARKSLMFVPALIAGSRWCRINCDVITSPAGTGASGGGTPPPAPAPAAAVPAPVAAPVQQSAGGVDVNAIVSAVRQGVQEQVTGLLAPIQQQSAALATRIDQMAAPNPQRQAAASRLFGAPGAAPGVRTGEDPLTSRGYQMYRALGFRQGALSADDCKIELMLSQRLMTIFRQAGFVPQGMNSILIPLGADCLPGMADDEVGEIRGLMRQGVSGMDPTETAFMLQNWRGGQQLPQQMSRRQALSMWDDTGLGILLGSTQQGELIPMLRNQEVFSRAGAIEMTLPPNGRLQLPKQTAAGTAYWVGESATITDSAPQTGYIDLIAKKLAVLTKLPNELLMYGSPSVEAFIRNDMTRVMALAADLAMLSGVGSTVKIKGLLTYPGIKALTAGVTGTNGDTLQPEDLGLMMGQVEDSNHDVDGLGWTWIMRPLYWYAIMNKRADVYVGGSGAGSTNQKGEFLFPTNRDDVSKGLRGNLLGYPVVKSNQVSGSIVKAGGSNLTQLIGGIFYHWLIARVGVMEFATSVQGDTAFTTDQTWVRAIQHLDAAPRYENAFAYYTSLLPTV
jgi:HK97 family phage major capsid protein